MAILISDKIDVNKKEYYQRDREGHFIMRKGSIHQEVIRIINMHVSNNSFKLHEKLTELIIEQLNKEEKLNNFLNHLDLIFTENQQFKSICSF